jgi:hypothetical protein
MKQIVNFGLFYAGWIACVAGAGQGVPWLGPVLMVPLLGIQAWLTPNLRLEIRFLAILGVLGLLLDSVFSVGGVLSYRPFPWPPPVAPLWIGVLWVLFGTTLGRSLAWLAERPGLAALLGLLGGPGSYWAGERLGAVSFGFHPLVSMVLIGLAWAAAMPALYWLHGRLAPEVAAAARETAAGRDPAAAYDPSDGGP